MERTTPAPLRVQRLPSLEANIESRQVIDKIAAERVAERARLAMLPSLEETEHRDVLAQMMEQHAADRVLRSYLESGLERPNMIGRVILGYTAAPRPEQVRSALVVTKDETQLRYIIGRALVEGKYPIPAEFKKLAEDRLAALQQAKKRQ